MGPFDYTSAFQGVGSAYDAAMKGFADGNAIQDRQAAEAAAIAARQQQAAMQAELLALSKNPTTQGIIAATIKYPSLSENLKRTFDMLDPQEQKAQISQGMPVFMALKNKQPEVARKVLLEQAAALRNSGKEQEAKAAEAYARQVEENPGAAEVTIGGMLAGVIGADKFSKIIGEQGAEARANELQPGLVRKGTADAAGAEADAQTKGVTAQFAERNAIADLEKKGWDVKAIQSDIQYKRDQTKIGYLNAQIAKENNGIQRQKLQLELDKAVQERDDKVREKVAKAESAATSIDNMYNTVERLLKNPALNDVLGSIEGRLPSVVSDDGADAIGLIEQLGSQAFLSQVPTIQGMGALSNAEGEKLQAALQNFKRTQSEAQFRANLREVQRLVLKGRENVSKRYGVPLAPVDAPAGARANQAPASAAPASSLPSGWSVEVN